MTKKRRIWGSVGCIMILLCLSGCYQNTEDQKQETIKESTKVFETAEQTSAAAAESDKRKPELWEVMDRILQEQDLEQVLDYVSGTDDTSKDAIIRLCQSEGGKYTAYGFISPEYGEKGILIDNIVDGCSNWNYFEEDWDYGDDQPMLVENGEYEAVFTFTQEKDGDKIMREMYFDTFDTGTMSPRE